MIYLKILNTFSTTGIYKSQRIVGLGLSTTFHAIIIQIEQNFFKIKSRHLKLNKEKKIIPFIVVSTKILMFKAKSNFDEVPKKIPEPNMVLYDKYISHRILYNID